MINVSVEKNQNESASSLIRRFTKRVQDSGVLPRVRSLKNAERTLSHYKRKKATLEVLRRKAETMKLMKLGKLTKTAKKK